MFADYHGHSYYSDDSTYPMEDVVRDAIGMGMEKICFTDHVDLIARYDEAGVYPFEKIRPVVEEILKIVIADGKGIELNTSSHRYGLKDSQPCTEILKLYRNLGGRILTIGSDSHTPAHLGAYIREDSLKLKELGFQYICTYENMEPIFHVL